MNCFNFLGGIRKHEIANSNDEKSVIIPAIIISGGIKEEDVVPFKDHLGIMDFMSKPLNLPKLSVMVMEILAKEYYITGEGQKIQTS